MDIKGRKDAGLDAVRMHPLFVNLLGNAGQHGTDGHPILVEINVSDTEVCFSVSNKGTQMTEDTLASISEPMTRHGPQLNRSDSANTSLGLGLHIAKAIAGAHMGSISVTSTDAYTTFTAHLPRDPALEPAV